MCTAVLLATGGVCCGRLVVDEWVCVFAFCAGVISKYSHFNNHSISISMVTVFQQKHSLIRKDSPAHQ